MDRAVSRSKNSVSLTTLEGDQLISSKITSEVPFYDHQRQLNSNSFEALITTKIVQNKRDNSLEIFPGNILFTVPIICH